MNEWEARGEPLLVVGLGNPGPRYHGTRHNVGFAVVDRLRERLGGGRALPSRGSELWELSPSRPHLFGLKPGRFMNRSGEAVAEVILERDIERECLLVIYDDLDLPTGRLRVRARGGSGGHRGMMHIIGRLGTEEFPRLRIGIGRSDATPVEDYVLGFPEEKEAEVLCSALDRAVEGILCWTEQGIQRAMERYNTSDE